MIVKKSKRRVQRKLRFTNRLRTFLAISISSRKSRKKHVHSNTIHAQIRKNAIKFNDKPGPRAKIYITKTLKDDALVEKSDKSYAMTEDASARLQKARRRYSSPSGNITIEGEALACMDVLDEIKSTGKRTRSRSHSRGRATSAGNNGRKRQRKSVTVDEVDAAVDASEYEILLKRMTKAELVGYALHMKTKQTAEIEGSPEDSLSPPQSPLPLSASPEADLANAMSRRPFVEIPVTPRRRPSGQLHTPPSSDRSSPAPSSFEYPDTAPVSPESSLSPSPNDQFEEESYHGFDDSMVMDADIGSPQNDLITPPQSQDPVEAQSFVNTKAGPEKYQQRPTSTLERLPSGAMRNLISRQVTPEPDVDSDSEPDFDGPTAYDAGDFTMSEDDDSSRSVDRILDDVDDMYIDFPSEDMEGGAGMLKSDMTLINESPERITVDKGKGKVPVIEIDDDDEALIVNIAKVNAVPLTSFAPARRGAGYRTNSGLMTPEPTPARSSNLPISLTPQSPQVTSQMIQMKNMVLNHERVMDELSSTKAEVERLRADNEEKDIELADLKLKRQNLEEEKIKYEKKKEELHVLQQLFGDQSAELDRVNTLYSAVLAENERLLQKEAKVDADRKASEAKLSEKVKLLQDQIETLSKSEESLHKVNKKLSADSTYWREEYERKTSKLKAMKETEKFKDMVHEQDVRRSRKDRERIRYVEHELEEEKKKTEELRKVISEKEEYEKLLEYGLVMLQEMVRKREDTIQKIQSLLGGVNKLTPEEEKWLSFVPGSTASIPIIID